MSNFYQHLLKIYLPLSLIVSPMTIVLNSATAENSLSQCQQPQNNEYLVLVVTNTRQTQQQLKNRVVNPQTINVCVYDQQTVTRVGGFIQFSQAEQWAQSINKDLKLMAIVVQPNDTVANSNTSATTGNTSPPATTTNSNPNNNTSATTTNSNPNNNTPATTTNSNSNNNTPATTTNTNNNYPPFKPKALGTGYAVLVDYFNQPQAAFTLKQITGQEVGLVSFQGRPYLLAIHQRDRAQAESILSNLSNQGFWTILVDSSKVTLLTSVVRY